MNENSNPLKLIIEHYRKIVEQRQPSKAFVWPLITGYNTKVASFKGTGIVMFIHSGNNVMKTNENLNELSPKLLGTENITKANIEQVRSTIYDVFNLKQQDGIVFIVNDNVEILELERLYERHEIAIGGSAMKIFLSHKGIDKPMVREFSDTLSTIGYLPWLDEDAMVAGVELERGILQGFKESCAAIFFITPEFKDESFIASEINYAIAQKREKGNRFAIITIVFEQNGKTGIVPELLKTYVWKKPNSYLEALSEIIKALPVVTSSIKWKQM